MGFRIPPFLKDAENDDGITRLDIVVSPDVGLVNEREVISTFLDEIKNGKTEFTADTWSQTGTQMLEQAGSIGVIRRKPIATPRGKILPFHVIQGATDKQ